MRNALRRLWWSAALALALAACGPLAPLVRPADSPYQRIAQGSPPGRIFLVRVDAAPERTGRHVSSPHQPQAAEVRAAACQGLEGTRFRCTDAGNPLQVADYLVRLRYDVIEDASDGGMHMGSRLGRAMLGGRQVPEDDPAQDAAQGLLWRVDVFRRGEGVPLYSSGTNENQLSLWRAGVTGWMKIHFTQ